MNRTARASEEPDEDDIYLRPLFLCRVQAGPPSTADDHVEERLNLNRFIFRNPSSTILHRVEDDSLEAFGIFRGDILVIDRSLQPEDRKLVLVEVGGEKVIRLAVQLREKMFLSAGGDTDMREELLEGAVRMLGVVTYSIHTLGE
jgi:DNA polymerase V